MDIRYILNPYIGMDELCRPWLVNYSMIKNIKYLKYIQEKENKNKEDEEKSNIKLSLKKK